MPALDPERVLFTPNFAPRAEYEFGFAKGVRVTLDNLYPLKMWPEVFRGREIFLRIDPGFGRGHHSHVRTAGVHTKFGIPLSEADELVALTEVGGRARDRAACAYRQRNLRCGELDRDRGAAGQLLPSAFPRSPSWIWAAGSAFPISWATAKSTWARWIGAWRDWRGFSAY